MMAYLISKGTKLNLKSKEYIDALLCRFNIATFEIKKAINFLYVTIPGSIYKGDISIMGQVGITQ